jgi:pseudouridine synthase
MSLERLHKVLARSGFGSRRACEELIAQGAVTVDGAVVREMGVRVDPARQKIFCKGEPVRPERPLTILLNKPRRVVTTLRDERGRRTVRDLIPGVKERIFPVGRLDWESQGLLLLTNDGELANLLTHPRYGVPRTYHVILKGHLTGEIVQRLQRGVWLAEGKTGPVKVLVKKREREGAVLEVTLREGMNREVRRIFARFGLRVRRLKRIRVGPLGLGRLREGEWRVLRPEEVQALRAAASGGPRDEAV